MQFQDVTTILIFLYIFWGMTTQVLDLRGKYARVGLGVQVWWRWFIGMKVSDIGTAALLGYGISLAHNPWWEYLPAAVFWFAVSWCADDVLLPQRSFLIRADTVNWPAELRALEDTLRPGRVRVRLQSPFTTQIYRYYGPVSGLSQLAMGFERTAQRIEATQ